MGSGRRARGSVRSMRRGFAGRRQGVAEYRRSSWAHRRAEELFCRGGTVHFETPFPDDTAALLDCGGVYFYEEGEPRARGHPRPAALRVQYQDAQHYGASRAKAQPHVVLMLARVASSKQPEYPATVFADLCIGGLVASIGALREHL